MGLSQLGLDFHAIYRQIAMKTLPQHPRWGRGESSHPGIAAFGSELFSGKTESPVATENVGV